MSAVVSLHSSLQRHKYILSKWNDISHPCHLTIQILIEYYENTKLKDINQAMVTSFRKAVDAQYIAYFEEKKVDPQLLIDQWIARARKCERCSCGGRWYPGNTSEDPNSRGYDVSIKDSHGFVNLMRRWESDENTNVLASEIEKLQPTDLEQLAMNVKGYTLNIATTLSSYYRTDY